jgi:uncharacterized cupin superfamily protein
MKNYLLPAIVGAAIALVAVKAWNVGNYLARSPGASASAEHRTMAPFATDPRWVKIKSGVPNFRASEVTRSADGTTFVGQWACDGPTTFEWSFGLDETVFLLDGLIEIEYLGRKFTLKPGDTAKFLAGTKAIWTVPEKAHKVYVLHDHGYALKAWRKVFRAD